jgi:hypothetical protein
VTCDLDMGYPSVIFYIYEFSLLQYFQRETLDIFRNRTAFLNKDRTHNTNITVININSNCHYEPG